MRWNLLRATVCWSAVALLMPGGPLGRSRAAEARVRPRPAHGAIHPERRAEPSPADGQHVAVNPPPLLWPATNGKRVSYAVRLSRDPAFPDGATRAAEGLRWAMFHPHARLAAGTWHWQWGVAAEPGAEPRWSKPLRFVVDETARVFAPPPAEQALAACPKSHPRLLATLDQLPELRGRAAGSPELEQIVSAATRYLGGRLPDPQVGRPKDKGANARQARSFAKWASKGYAARLVRPVTWLAPAFLLTGDERFGREAVRRAMAVAQLDPDGVTARRVSDFADGSCMRAMALAYDSCHALLSEAQRQQLRRAMAARATRFFASQANNLETRIFNAHVWQHILAEFAEVAFATLGELPDAATWAAYVYELWVARFPTLGGDDGGWANGLNYFGTNFETLLALPALFGRLTGVDFLDHPWYRNVAWYQLYGWPPGSASDSFGDGSERDGLPPLSRGFFLQAIGRRFRNPHALWYADQVIGERRLQASPFQLMRSLVAPPPADLPTPTPPTNLPQARAFRDIGIVSMHTALGDTPRDLMLAFRSSPYGATNHMHACQNSFNLLFGGQRLFANSGYYIAYADEHYKGWYKHTRGHNTVLIDGKGQSWGTRGYGWVARFLHGHAISYCLGDASAAYGDAGLTVFRRHIALLRPSTVVVYDELQADHPARWAWLLHSKARIQADTARRRLVAATACARAQVDLAASAPVGITVHNRFDPPAVNWRKKKSGGKLIVYPDQWHATVGNTHRQAALRILAIIQVHPAGAQQPFAQPTPARGGAIRVGQWHIQAGLDASKPATLVIRRDGGAATLAADVASVVVDGKPTDLPAWSALLAEPGHGIRCQCRDEIPTP